MAWPPACLDLDDARRGWTRVTPVDDTSDVRWCACAPVFPASKRGMGLVGSCPRLHQADPQSPPRKVYTAPLKGYLYIATTLQCIVAVIIMISQQSEAILYPYATDYCDCMSHQDHQDHQYCIHTDTERPVHQMTCTVACWYTAIPTTYSYNVYC